MGQVKSQNITKLSQLLVSLSLCSLLFSPSSLLAFLHYFNLYFSSFPFQIFSHSIDKNCMFLLCNGLLVFVGITKSFSGSKPDLGDDDESLEDIPRYQFSEVEAKDEMIEKEESEVETTERAEKVEQEDIEMAIVEDEEEGKEGGLWGLNLKEADEESGILEAGDDEEEEETRSENDGFLIEDDVEEKEVQIEENSMLTAEEMNRKFDDFIRRMKEDLRIEAQRQLVMV